jgi:hypothetical protein
MSDANLLGFGCAVTFIALAGAYVFIRQSFMAGQKPAESEAQSEDADQQVRDVA